MTANPKGSSPFLNITERQAGDVTILDLTGNIIMGGGSAQLRDAMERLVREDRKKIILNFAGVKYIDSSGVGELVSGWKALNTSGAGIKLLHVSERVEEVLALSSLLAMFEIYEDESKALDEFE